MKITRESIYSNRYEFYCGGIVAHTEGRYYLAEINMFFSNKCTITPPKDKHIRKLLGLR